MVGPSFLLIALVVVHLLWLPAAPGNVLAAIVSTVFEPYRVLRLRLRQLTPDEMGEEPDELDLAEIEHDPEESHRRL